MSLIPPLNLQEGSKIILVQTPQERRYQLKTAQAEANIRRFDASGRDSPRRNYWWGGGQVDDAGLLRAARL